MAYVQVFSYLGQFLGRNANCYTTQYSGATTSFKPRPRLDVSGGRTLWAIETTIVHTRNNECTFHVMEDDLRPKLCHLLL
jgi:hypothetical protein